MAEIETGSELFDRRWSTYDQILAGNHLFHKELYAELRTFLRHTFESSPVDVLDLGCGDCQYLVEQLTKDGNVCKIASFTGVDLAAGALELARGNIQRVVAPGTPLHFAHTDIVDFVSKCTQRFNLAFASYSVHHLTLEEKDQLVHYLAKLLQPGGVYFQVDVLRRPSEGLPEYYDRFVKHIQSDWTTLTPEARADISKHARASDLPETLETWEGLARKHGFASCQLLEAHPHPDTGFCLVLRK